MEVMTLGEAHTPLKGTSTSADPAFIGSSYLPDFYEELKAPSGIQEVAIPEEAPLGSGVAELKDVEVFEETDHVSFTETVMASLKEMTSGAEWETLLGVKKARRTVENETNQFNQLQQFMKSHSVVLGGRAGVNV
jgi:hypothetical protein